MFRVRPLDYWSLLEVRKVGRSKYVNVLLYMRFILTVTSSCLSIWVRYLPVLMLRVSATLYCGNWFLKGKFTRLIFDNMTCFGECMISMIIGISDM